MQTGGSNSQSVRYLQHVAWPGRLKFAIRLLFTALGVAREAQIRNPLAIYSILAWPESIFDVKHFKRFVMGRGARFRGQR